MLRFRVRRRTWICRFMIRVSANVLYMSITNFVKDLLVFDTNRNMTNFSLTWNALFFWDLFVHYVTFPVDN